MKQVFVAGHNGMVGSALVKELERDSDVNIVTRAREELDLRNQRAVQELFASNKIDEVYLAAAKVGGINANHSFPAQFIYDNLMIESNIIHESFKSGVKKLLFLGSSCIYPEFASQPISEDALMTGKLAPSNEPYAIAKIAGIKLCESYNRQHGTDFRSVMPTNLYGPNDNFHYKNSHVIPALLRKFHDAKVNGNQKVTVWGSGKPRREFLHVNDLAKASSFIMDLDKKEYEMNTETMLSHINVGCGKDCSIEELAKIIGGVVGFKGSIEFDSSQLDGTPRKLLNVEKLSNLGWSHTISLKQGLENTYSWFLHNQENFRQN